MNMQESNQPSFQAGRLVVIYHDFRNPRSASTASTNRITRVAARFGRRNMTKLTISMLPASCQVQSSIKKVWRLLRSKAPGQSLHSAYVRSMSSDLLSRRPCKNLLIST